MKFSAAKMVARLTKEGRANEIDDSIMAIMEKLDGQEATENCWERRVLGCPVYYVVGKDGIGEYVNEADCE